MKSSRYSQKSISIQYPKKQKMKLLMSYEKKWNRKYDIKFVLSYTMVLPMPSHNYLSLSL